MTDPYIAVSAYPEYAKILRPDPFPPLSGQVPRLTDVARQAIDRARTNLRSPEVREKLTDVARAVPIPQKVREAIILGRATVAASRALFRDPDATPETGRSDAAEIYRAAAAGQDLVSDAFRRLRGSEAEYEVRTAEAAAERYRARADDLDREAGASATDGVARGADRGATSDRDHADTSQRGHESEPDASSAGDDGARQPGQPAPDRDAADPTDRRAAYWQAESQQHQPDSRPAAEDRSGQRGPDPQRDDGAQR
jgi:hypothetical protein